MSEQQDKQSVTIPAKQLESAAHDLAFKLLTTCKKGNTIHVDRVDKLEEFVAGLLQQGGSNPA